jgi:CRISPR-associated protein Csm4
MKRYVITIIPLSGFGTPLAGDTLFGHFCWQLAYDSGLAEGGLEAALARYDGRPFAVFSSAFPVVPPGKEGEAEGYALPRPSLPPSWLFSESGDRRQRIKSRKERKKSGWMLASSSLEIKVNNQDFCSSETLAKKFAGKPLGLYGDAPVLEKHSERPHNTINRVTNTTGEGVFAPYSIPCSDYLPGARLAVLVLLDPEATDIDRVRQGLSRIGQFGFGRDASTGMGRFTVEGARETALRQIKGANSLYTLAPCVPTENQCQGAYYFTPMVRYGRHGDRLATSQVPYKAPVVMAAPGAVFSLAPGQNAPLYIGRAVRGVSRIEPKTVHQGYAPCLPFRLEVPQ